MVHRIWTKSIRVIVAAVLLLSSIAPAGWTAGTAAAAAKAVLTVADAIAKNNDGKSYTVEGYVVGFAISSTTFTRDSAKFNSDTNLVIADSAEETAEDRTLFVQIASPFRQEFGLQSNLGLIGSRIRVTGTLEEYFKPHRGVKSTTFMEKVTVTPPDQAASVTAIPPSGAVQAGTRVSLSSPTVTASVYYNLNGNSDKSEFIPYTQPIEITGPTTIKAYAKQDGLKDSDIAEFIYSVVTSSSIAEARGGNAGDTALVQGIVTYREDTGSGFSNLYIQDDTAGIVVRGQNITAEQGDKIEVQGRLELYNGLLQLNKEPGGSLRMVEPGLPLPAAKPITSADFAQEAGKQYEGQLVEVAAAAIDRSSGSTYYATDQLGAGIVIYAKNVPAALAVSRTYERIAGVLSYHSSYGYQLIPRAYADVVETELSVTASLPSGNVAKGSEIALSTPASGGVIYYTLDGTEPTQASARYAAPIAIQEDTTIKAIVVKDGAISAVYTFTYKVLKDTGHLLIHDIQGEGHRSPYADQAVTGVEGIVTFKRDKSNFYIQESNPDRYSKDGRASDAILVYHKDSPAKVGDQVKVAGVVKEYKEKTYSSNPVDLTTTEIAASSVDIISHDQDLPPPVVLGKDRMIPPSIITDGYQLTDAYYDPERNALDLYESLEGMRVMIENPDIIGPYKYEIPVSVRQEGSHPVVSPAGGLVLTEGSLNPQRVLVSLDYMTPKPNPVVKTGDRFTEPLIGVIAYSFSNYKLLPERLPEVESGKGKPAVTSIVADSEKLTIASFNVENYWNDPSTKGKEKTRKIGDVIVRNLKSPDIIGLMEVQDNNGDTDNGVVDASRNYDAIIGAIQAAGGPVYHYTDIDPEDKMDGGAPGGNIRVGFLYNPERVTLANSQQNAKGDAKTAVRYGPDGLTYNPGRIEPANEAFDSSRKPLAAEFLFRGERVLVIANHFNSKGGDHAPYGGIQPPQRSSEVQRAKQAALVHSFVSEVLTHNPQTNVVLIGDLNDFQFSDTLRVVAGNELFNLVDGLPEARRYSYIYEGNSQTLDHILADNKLAKRAELDIVHINADFMEAHGRVSDHDPLLAQLQFGKPDDEEFQLRLLHTNDTHAHLDSVPRRITAIKEARGGADHSLLLDAGDVFSGTLYFNKYEGLADLDFMNLVGYDAMTFGNHEFDAGPAKLANFIKQAKFPFVSSNIDFDKEPELQGMFQHEIGHPGAEASIYPAIILDVDGEKVGVFGLTTEDTAFLASPGEHIAFRNYAESARATVAMLREEGIDKIIALTHLGYEVDRALAESVEGIDIIIGGHSHTKLTEPAVIERADGERTLIVQTGEYGRYLGELDVTFDRNGALTDWSGKLTDIDAKDASGQYVFADDAEAAAKLAEYAGPLEEFKKQVIGKTKVFLDGERGSVRKQETNLGNLIADSMRAKVQRLLNETGVKGYVTIQNGGGIRASIQAGDITLGDLLTVMPFGNNLSAVKMTGEEIIAALENGVSGVETGQGRFPQVSGMRFYYDSTKKGETVDAVTGEVTQKGERIVKVQVKNDDGTYADIDPQGYYIVATNSFMADGGDFYRSMKQAKNDGRFYELNIVDYEVFIEHLDRIGIINAGVEGRITDLKGGKLPEEPGPNPNPNPGPGTGSGSGSSSSSDSPSNPSPTPSPKPAEDKPGTVTATPEKLAAIGGGAIVFEMPAGTGEVKFPSNTYGLLLQNKLEVKSEHISIEIPAELMKQLINKWTDNEKQGSVISLKLAPLAKEAANERIAKAERASGMKVRLSGDMYELGLMITLANGTTEKLTSFDQPVVLRLTADSGFKPRRAGIYAVSGSGTATQAEGDYDRVEMAALIREFGTYAILEMTKPFADLPSGHWAYGVIQELALKRIISGTSATKFEPARAITRAEFTALLAQALKLRGTGGKAFADVDADAWYAAPVAAAHEAGIVSGKSANRFDPAGAVTREEMAVMLVKAYEVKTGKKLAVNAKRTFSDADRISLWAVEHVNAAAGVGLMKGRATGRFVPGAEANRAEAAQAIYNLLIDN
ncbi:5'-nucleotidase C-terminal domain-containing protein [Paenibacillus dendritiformis]|uniref:5'-Nucleotidase domain-containing protein n=1 Tax=Paenibacillus dendritiformis C454 TaxID=1131935 RepID=H3SKD4_9BACL|nr:5'-nucleotidase C-terminal domain-containing protein [Paenibacillus dendritiformis]EHQ60460.1 5'-Nucleotidase domain-containing protein [Paenibacillus dendritiformis C454]CAH8768430.1 5'-nucleotidase C-terminal domain-containing protein [Paenibacillus dendritiformis]